MALQPAGKHFLREWQPTSLSNLFSVYTHMGKMRITIYVPVDYMAWDIRFITRAIRRGGR
jgi:hypothetical protein